MITREELKAHCERTIEQCEFWARGDDEKLNNSKIYQEHTFILELLEQNSKMTQFAIWVVKKIFDEQWEYNKDAFEELACRKLSELGIVKEKGGKWEFDPKESEDDE